MRISVLFDNLGPYHLARLAAAADRCELTAIELHATSQDYMWQRENAKTAFVRQTVFGSGQESNRDVRDPVSALVNAIEASEPQVMAIPGWSGWHAFAALRWCTANKVPVVVMSESTAHDEPRTPWKEWIKQKYLSLCSAALVGGISHAQYLSQLRMPADKIFQGYDVVDNQYFEEKGQQVRAEERERRQQLALPHRYFLASCRFIAKKNLARLINAYAEYRSAVAAAGDGAHGPWDLIVLGDGKLRDELHAVRHQRGLDSCVHFPGFRQYEELPAYYSLATAFIHASTVEPWGLVVNEAMASGLPVLVSDRCGCAPTLVRVGENGQTFDPSDTQAITARMLEITGLPAEQRQAMGCRSRQIIAEWGPAKFAEGLHAAATAALASPAKSARLVDRFVLQALLRKGVPRRIAG